STLSRQASPTCRTTSGGSRKANAGSAERRPCVETALPIARLARYMHPPTRVERLRNTKACLCDGVAGPRHSLTCLGRGDQLVGPKRLLGRPLRRVLRR